MCGAAETWHALWVGGVPSAAVVRGSAVTLCGGVSLRRWRVCRRPAADVAGGLPSATVVCGLAATLCGGGVSLRQRVCRRAAANVAGGLALLGCVVRLGLAVLWSSTRLWLALRERIATWLILPVVICLSQRLSHACVSINSFVL